MNEYRSAAIRSGMRIKPVGYKGLLYGFKANQVIAACNALLGLVIKRGETDELQLTENKSILQLVDFARLLSGGSGSLVQRFRIKSTNADTWTCRTWDSTTEGSSDVIVAKQATIRNSIATEVIGGFTWHYTYDITFLNRTAASGGFVTENQSVYPNIGTNKEIWAADVSDSGGTGVVGVDWLDISGSHDWATIPVQPPP